MSIDETEIRKEFKALFDNSLDLIYAHDLRGNFFDANDIALETLGYKRDDIPNLSFKNLIDKNQIVNALNIIKDLKEKRRQSKRSEFKLKTKDGNSIYVETYGIPLKKKGKIYGILGIANNITERKKAENKLKESESKFRTITEQLLMGIVILQDNVLKYVNEAVAKIGIYTPQEIIGWSLNDFVKLIHPDDLPFIMEQAKKKQAGETDVATQYSCRIFTKSGELKWVDVYSKSILYEGKPADFITLVDITDKKKAEQALKESEKRLKEFNKELEQIVKERTQDLKQSEKKHRRLINNISDVIIESDNSGNFIYISPQVTDLFGYKPEEVIGKNALQFIHPEDLQNARNKMEKAFNSENEVSIEFRTLHKDGHYVPVSINGQLIKGDEEDFFIAVIRDITEKKEAEQKLKESEEKYRHLFENSPFSILLADTKGNIMECNSTIEKLYGIKKEEIISKNYKEILPLFKVSELETFFEDRNKRILEGIITPAIEIPSYSEDGSLVWINLHSSLVKLGEKKFIQVILQDITERKVAEKELKKLNRELEYKVIERTKELEKSEKKFRQILESIPDLFFLVDDKTTIIDYRGKREEFFIPPEQFLSEKLSNILPFKLGKMAKEYVSKTISSKQPQILEYSLPMKGKDQFYEARLLFFSENRVAIFIRNITERKEAEQKLKESEIKFRRICESIPDLFFLVSEDSTILEYRGKVEHLYAPPKEFMGKRMADVVPSNLGQEILKKIRETIATKKPQILEYILPIRGKEQYYEARHLFFSKEQVAIFIRDITERKLTEKELKESEEKYRTLFDEAPIGILTCDVNGNILNVNTSALKLLGSPSKEATKKINLLTFPLLMKAGISADFKKCIMENRKISSERPYISKWGKSMFFRSKLVPTLDQEGKTIKVLGTFDDISNLKLAEQKLRKSEEKLRKQNIELRRLDELKNDFITIAAHELKTPMVSITGYTDYILTHNKDLDFEIRKDLLLIQKNSQRLNLLIEKLLDVMKIDAKKMEIIREEKNIYDIIENCVEELSFQINDKKLNVIVDVQKDLYLRVDPNRIYEVFSNLFLNAVKFTLNGGNIEISAKKIKNQFLFKVRNEGEGLNIRDIRKLFKKFEVIKKESADHINRKKGLGLGLYISKGVVEAHGGKIWGTSKGKNKGAEFYFTLPIIEA